MKGKKGVVIFMLVATVLFSSFAFYAYQVLYSPNFLIDKEKKVLMIERGTTFKVLQNKLYDQHYINDLVSFSFLAKLMNYDKKVKPGRYVIEPNMTNLQAIRLLRAGHQSAVKVTFNNVRKIEDLGERITKNLLMTEDEFDSALHRFVDSSEEFNEYNIISMFVPNTYSVYYDISAHALIERMHKEFDKFWTADRLEKARALNFTRTDVVTLASIVNAESIKREEADIIAGLYINRLRQRIPLQADPTLVFAGGDFSLKRVLNVHKEIDSPYNTYKNYGLPPGPINMPPISVIDAVLNYEDHNYIYMCAKEDFSGYHYFAETLREHINNANKYQRQLTIEQRKARENGN